MAVKTFGTNKRYAINYLNKIKQNNKITFSIMVLSTKGWQVMYEKA